MLFMHDKHADCASACRFELHSSGKPGGTGGLAVRQGKPVRPDPCLIGDQIWLENALCKKRGLEDQLCRP